jgi:translocation and assembly module TamB
VPVRLENGRVHHENLTLTANGFTVTTTGSVGLDGSLQLSAEVPVPETAVGPLLRNNPKLREAIAAKRIRVPVGGTIAKPQLDQRAFQAAVRQYAEEVAKDAARGKVNELIEKNQDKLRGEIEKKLDRFLPLPPPPPAKK